MVLFGFVFSSDAFQREARGGKVKKQSVIPQTSFCELRA